MSKNIYEITESTKLANLDKEVKAVKTSNDFGQKIFDRDVENEKQVIFDAMENIYSRAKEALKELKNDHAKKVKEVKVSYQTVPGSNEEVKVEERSEQQRNAIAKASEVYENLRIAFDEAIENSTWENFQKLDNLLKKIKK